MVYRLSHGLLRLGSPLLQPLTSQPACKAQVSKARPSRPLPGHHHPTTARVSIPPQLPKSQPPSTTAPGHSPLPHSPGVPTLPHFPAHSPFPHYLVVPSPYYPPSHSSRAWVPVPSVLFLMFKTMFLTIGWHSQPRVWRAVPTLGTYQRKQLQGRG